MKSQKSLVEKCRYHDAEVRAAQFTLVLGRQSNLMLLTPANGDKAPTLTWVLHHAVYDGWSFHQYLTEVNNRYYKSTLGPVTSFGKIIRYLRKIDSHTAQTFGRRIFMGLSFVISLRHP